MLITELAQKLAKKIDECITIANNCMVMLDEAQAENEMLSTKVATLQAQLDRICLPIKTDGDVGHIRRTVIPLLCEQCKDISAQTLERVLDYLDSQKLDEAEG